MLDAINDGISVNSRPVTQGGALIFGMASSRPLHNTTNPHQKCEDFLHLMLVDSNRLLILCLNPFFSGK